MDRETWWAIVHGISRVRHNLATKQSPPLLTAINLLLYLEDLFWNTLDHWTSKLSPLWKATKRFSDLFSTI